MSETTEIPICHQGGSNGNLTASQWMKVMESYWTYMARHYQEHSQH
ncbi:MAG: hypothetical protein IPN46_12680 [Saprospiraceae bacterium]|nr:hypothetical protein [Saprospiraceae bacterium]